jgi:hypothetical protein
MDSKIIFSLKTGKCGPRRLIVGNLIAVGLKGGGAVFSASPVEEEGESG